MIAFQIFAHVFHKNSILHLKIKDKMKTDIIIIGAGPSGTIAASMIKQAGLNAIIIEKEQFPRFVIGESLLPRCMDVLEAAGYLDAVEKYGFQKKYGAVFLRKDQVCQFNFDEQHTKGWTWTWQVPRDEFDKVLADEAERKGVDIRYQTQVTNIEFFDKKQLVYTKNSAGKEIIFESKFVIDASGYGRVIPRLLNLDTPSSLGPRSSLFTHVEDLNRPEGDAGDRITIVDAEPGVWIWIIPFSNGKTSVGFVAPPEHFEKYKGNEEAMLRNMLADEPHTAERFKDVPYAFSPKFIPGYSIAVKELKGNGWVLTGNASEFLDPVFSSGVTFAVETGWKAGILAAKEVKGEKVDWNTEYINHVVKGVDTFKTYVNSWYDDTLQTIFFSEKINPKIKGQICSVLAGYVWDTSNSYVRNHRNAVKTLSSLIKEGVV